MTMTRSSSWQRRRSNLRAGLSTTRRAVFPLSFEKLEDRYCLVASGELSLPLPNSPLITEQQALAVALNDITVSADGFVIANRQHCEN